MIVIVPLFTFEILKTPKFLPTPILIGMILAGIVNVCLILAMGIFVTHKIAGPMYSLVRSFRMITEGDYTQKVNIREGDDLKYVVRNFNEMADALKERCVDDRDAVAEVLNDQKLPEESRGKLQQLLERYELRLNKDD